jgi:hypothetical protein
VQDDNRIAGKLQDGTRVFKLEGLYDAATSVFTVQAASSDIVFSISGKLDDSNTLNTEASHAAVHRRVDGEWATESLAITADEQTVESGVNQTGGAALPAWGKGIWYDQMSGEGVEFIVTDNAITYILTWSYSGTQHSIVKDIAVVEIEPVSAEAVNLIVRAPLFRYNLSTGNIIEETIYTARYYCANSFDTKLNDAIGNTTLASLGVEGMPGVTVAQAVSMLDSGDKVFVAPYCSDSEPEILDGETDDWGYSPRFVGESATAHAKTAAVLRAFEGETFALMHTAP